jgi:hypothetical protein
VARSIRERPVPRSVIDRGTRNVPACRRTLGRWGIIAAALVGFGIGAEADVTPYILSRYLGLRSFAMLYGFTWTV